MTRRAKYSVLIALVGGLTASGTSLNPEQRNKIFQPGGSGSLTSAAILKPAGAAALTGAVKSAGGAR